MEPVRGTPLDPVTSFDGTALYAEEIGAGPTVVLAHGFCLNHTCWQSVVRELSEGFRLVLFDMRGHGLSAMPETEDWSWDALARDMAAVIDACSPSEPVVVVGHSMGGMAALAYLRLFGDSRLRALALVDTCARDVIGGMVPAAATLATPALRLLEQAASAAAARNPDGFDRVRRARRDLVSVLVRLMGFGASAPREQVQVMERMLSAVPAEVLVPIVVTLRGFDESGALDEIDVPTLVVVGSRDRLTPPAAAKRMATEIHHATLKTIRGCGHMPMLERPEEFNAILRAFLANPGAVYAGKHLEAHRLAPEAL